MVACSIIAVDEVMIGPDRQRSWLVVVAVRGGRQPVVVANEMPRGSKTSGPLISEASG